MKVKIIDKESKKKLSVTNYEYFICAKSYKVFKTIEVIKNRKPGAAKKTAKTYAAIEECPGLTFTITFYADPPPSNRHIFTSYKKLEELYNANKTV